MEKNIIDPMRYSTWVGFAHEYCKGCAYEIGTRGSECGSCVPKMDTYYFRRQTVIITKDEKGKNIAEVLRE